MIVYGVAATLPVNVTTSVAVPPLMPVIRQGLVGSVAEVTVMTEGLLDVQLRIVLPYWSGVGKH